MNFLLTRPRVDSDKLAQNFISLGHQVHLEPLLRIDYLKCRKIDLDNFQAVIFTSANGVRAFKRTYQARDIPCFAVGKATASAAYDASFQWVSTADGNIDGLIDLVIDKLDPDEGPLIHICGQNVTGNLSDRLEEAGFKVTSHPLYKATKATNLSPETQELIRSGNISHIPFYSPRTAKTFVELLTKANLKDNITNITALCLSDAVSNVISSLNWNNILTASKPDQISLLKLIDITLEETRQ